MQLFRLSVFSLTTLSPFPTSLTLHILRNMDWSDPNATPYRLLFDEGQSLSSVCVGLASVVVVIEMDEGAVVVGVVVSDPVDRGEEETIEGFDLLESAPPTPPPTAAPMTTTVATAIIIQNVFLLRPQMRRFEKLMSWCTKTFPAGFSVP